MAKSAGQTKAVKDTGKGQGKGKPTKIPKAKGD
jgi:hypothetical protein